MRAPRIPHSASKWICIGIAIGFMPLFMYGIIWFERQQSIGKCLTTYRFTSASLDCASYEESSQRLQKLDGALGDARRLYIKEGKVTRMSVWVRDLESKQWAATKENETYAPASLMKVPLMVAYYKLAEIDPRILEEQIQDTQTSDLNLAETYSNPSTLVAGRHYSVKDLIAHMATESDNNATALLFANINQDFFSQTLVDLGITIPSGTSTIDFVTVKSYANIFRNLYSASYLNREYSEKALELLSASSSFSGIAALLPLGTVIADKYGERATGQGASGKVELHDCGIVYAKPSPYSLCIMTEGQNYDDLLWVIRSVSALTYQALSK